jgi:hypothetical protein
MKSHHSLPGNLFLLGLFTQFSFAQDNPCKSFGVDFQDGGSYFQNSLANQAFTFVSKFEGTNHNPTGLIFITNASIGCQQDVADNILVDPNADQYECSQTNLTPDDTPELSTW